MNTEPVFPETPNVSAVACGGAANTRSDGNGTIGTDIFKVWTAGANGGFINKVRLTPYATVAATGTTATTIRVFLSSAAAGAVTVANCWLLAEIGAGAQSADHSTNPVSPLDVVLNMPVPAGYTILVANHVVNAANTGWMATAFGGNY